VTAFVNLLNRLAGDTGAAVLLVGHPNKSGDGYSGSTAWLNAVRSQLLLTHDQDTDERLLMSCKANYSRNGTEVRFHWHEWAFLRSDDLAPSARDQYAEIGRANVENEAFLRCLRVRNDQGVERGVGPSLARITRPASSSACRRRGHREESPGEGNGAPFRLGGHKHASGRSPRQIRQKNYHCGGEIMRPEPSRTCSRTPPEHCSRTLPNPIPNAPNTHPYTTYRAGAALGGAPACLMVLV
jgi:hypothetical protein